MKIGIMGAMPEEINLLKESMTVDKVDTIGERIYFSGDLYGKDSVIVFSRWGKVAAASTATTLINKFGVDLIIFTGVAGAISNKLNIGDVVIADKLVQHDMDTRPIFPRFQIPLTNRSHFDPHKNFSATAKDATDRFLQSITKTLSQKTLSEFQIDSPKAYVGTIASGDQFIASAEKARDLDNEIENLMCVEMEGASVAQVCEDYGVPCVVVRTISDKADHSAHIDFQKFIKEVASHYSKEIIENMFSIELKS